MENMILCPTRGGQASYPNQNWVIELARQRGVEILFLYVSNIQFLDQSWMPKIVDIETELEEMGDFLLAMAQERAAKAGVTAHTTVQRGDFRGVLEAIIDEHPVDTVVLGSSGEGPGLITSDYMRELGEQISAQKAVSFIVLHAGEVVCSFPDE